MTDKFVSVEKDSTSLTLLEQATDNDSKAWQKLVDLYAPLVYMRCRNQWGFSAEDSLQIGQEVFIKVSSALGKFHRQRTGSFRRWLRTIVDNQCKDEKRKQQIALSAGGTNAWEALKNHAESEIDLDDQPSDQDERSTLMNQAAKLVEAETSSRDWKIFWRVTIDHSDRQLVAEEFEVTDNVVYLACSRIKKRLKATFQELLDDDLFTTLESPNI